MSENSPYEEAKAFASEDVPHKSERQALADLFGNCNGSDGWGVFSWTNKWLAVKEIEALMNALIDQRIAKAEGRP